MRGLDDAELVADHECSGAEQHAVVAQRAEASGNVSTDCRKSPIADRLQRGDAEAIVEKIHRTRQHDFREVECADQGGQGLAEVAPGLFEERRAVAVALGAKALREKGSGNERLETSPPSALAQLAILVDDDVPDLTGREVI